MNKDTKISEDNIQKDYNNKQEAVFRFHLPSHQHLEELYFQVLDLDVLFCFHANIEFQILNKVSNVL